MKKKEKKNGKGGALVLVRASTAVIKTPWQKQVGRKEFIHLKLSYCYSSPEKIQRGSHLGQKPGGRSWSRSRGECGGFLLACSPWLFSILFFPFLENPGPLALGASPTIACVGLLFLRSHWPPAQKGERSRSPKQRMDGSEYEGKNSQESTSERQLIFFCSGGKVYKGS